MDQPTYKPDRTGRPDSGAGSRPDVVPVSDLLGHRDAVYLEHRGERYLLRITRNGKLILTK